MSNLKEIVRELEKERNRIDRAIRALRAVRSTAFPKRTPTKQSPPVTRRTVAAAVPKRRTLSAAARKRIAEAQRARWARVKAGKK